MRAPNRALLTILAAVACLPGCAVVYDGNFSFPGVPCRPLDRTLHGWCVVEVPSVGHVGYSTGNAGQLEHSTISFRLAPREGVTAAWSSTDVTLVDLDANKSMQIKALDTKPVTGRRMAPNVAEDSWVLHGLYAEGQFRLEPRIAKMEVRLPPILRDGQMIPVAPVRITDGPRTPKLVSVFALGGH